MLKVINILLFIVLHQEQIKKKQFGIAKNVKQNMIKMSGLFFVRYVNMIFVIIAIPTMTNLMVHKIILLLIDIVLKINILTYYFD